MAICKILNDRLFKKVNMLYKTFSKNHGDISIYGVVSQYFRY